MDELLREKEAADWIKKSVQSLRNDRSLGRGIPYLKLRRSIRYSVKDVEEYLKNHRIETSAEEG